MTTRYLPEDEELLLGDEFELRVLVHRSGDVWVADAGIGDVYLGGAIDARGPFSCLLETVTEWVGRHVRDEDDK